jgi:hypothetical protein
VAVLVGGVLWSGLPSGFPTGRPDVGLGGCPRLWLPGLAGFHVFLSAAAISVVPERCYYKGRIILVEVVDA